MTAAAPPLPGRPPCCCCHLPCEFYTCKTRYLKPHIKNIQDILVSVGTNDKKGIPFSRLVGCFRMMHSGVGRGLECIFGFHLR